MTSFGNLEGYRMMVEAAVDAIVVVDADGLVLYANPACEAILGRNPGELLGFQFGYPAASRKPVELLILREGQTFFVEMRSAGIVWHGEEAFVASLRDITDRRRAENNLRSSEERYRSLFENMVDGLAYCRMIYDGDRPVDFIYLDVNKAFGTLTGLKDVVGKRVSEVIPGIRDCDPQLFEIYGRVATTGCPEKVEIYLESLRQWFFLSVYSPKSGFFIVVFEVITERKQVEEKLSKKRKMLRHILDSIPQSVFWKDRDSIYLGCNEVFARHAGVDGSEEIVGKTDFDLAWSHEESEAYRADDRQVMEYDRPKVHIVETQQRTDGNRRWIDTTKIPLRDEEGRVYGVLGVYEDITDIKKDQEDLKHLRMAVDQAAEAVLITNTQGDIQYANPAFAQITGYSVEEAIGQNMKILKSGLHDDMFYKNFWGTISAGNVWEGRFQNKRKDGTQYEEQAIISPVRDSEGTIFSFVAVKREVTQEVLLQRQLQTAQRMEAVGTLAGGIAHDFNNALTGIFGYGEMLRSQLAGNERALSNLEEVLRCAERASTLTRQLLTYARRQIIEPVNLTLNAVVTDLLKLVSKIMGGHIELRTSLARSLPTIRADRGQLEQVVMNLVLNARDAMPGGGQLVIETGSADLDAEYVRYHPYMSVGAYVVLTVSDTGTGMDQKTRERVFEPFFTTKGPEKGTGLGLAVVYGIVKQHGGFIHLYSEPGKGTTFRVYFPMVEGAPEVVVSAKSSEIRGGTETILLAEDDESVRTLAERALKNLGYTVLVGRNGEEAIESFRENKERISLALLDVVMPQKGGKEAYEIMHQAKPGLKVIFMSGYTANSVHESFVLIAGVPFLAKPFGPGALARKVREVLDG